MTSLIRISCPTCGGRLSAVQDDENLSCENCGNQYLVQQKGNSISLVPIKSKEGASVVGDSNVIVQVNTTPPPVERQYSELKAPVVKVDCPICGKIVFREDTFRCKRCRRENICTSHQDKETFLCLECSNELKAERRTTRKNATSKWLGILSLVLGVGAVVFACVYWYHADEYYSYRRSFEFHYKLSQNTKFSPESREADIQAAKTACSDALSAYSDSGSFLAAAAIFGIFSLLLGIVAIILRKRLFAWVGVGLSLLTGVILLGVSLSTDVSYVSCYF